MRNFKKDKINTKKKEKKYIFPMMLKNKRIGKVFGRLPIFLMHCVRRCFLESRSLLVFPDSA